MEGLEPQAQMFQTHTLGISGVPVFEKVTIDMSLSTCYAT